MLFHKKSHTASHIPVCLKEDANFFREKFSIHNNAFQFIPLHKGGCSENFLLKTQTQTVFIKKPHQNAKQIVKNILHSLTLAKQAHFMAPKILAESPHYSIVMEFIKGRSVPSPKIKEKHLNQIWKEYQKFKTIPVNQITKSPCFFLPDLYDLCQRRLAHLPKTSFVRSFLFQIIENVFMSFPKSELVHHPKKIQAIHGDFHNNNLLFQGDKFVGIIDWEELTTGYASEDWLRYTFCLVERFFNYYQRRIKINRVLKFLLDQKTFSKHEWALGFDSVLLQKINKILNDKNLSLFRLFKAVLFVLFWQNEKDWVFNQLGKSNTLHKKENR